MSTEAKRDRTEYRDLKALQEELRYPIWQENRRNGLEEGIFLPPQKLTLLEAITLCLAARPVSRYSDEQDHNIESDLKAVGRISPQ